MLNKRNEKLKNETQTIKVHLSKTTNYRVVAVGREHENPSRLCDKECNGRYVLFTNTLPFYLLIFEARYFRIKRERLVKKSNG